MFSRLFHKFKKVAWFLPGILLWAAFPPMGERTDCLFALAPLMWLSRREASAGFVAKRWFQAGIGFWLATLSWMPAIVKNGGPWPLVVLGWFALAAYCAAYFAAYGWLSARAWSWARRGAYVRRLATLIFVEPVLWCGLELMRSRLFGGFSWNQLGVVPVNSGFGAPAAIGGVYLCSAVVVLFNGTVAGIVERMWRPERSGFASLRRLGPIETLLVFVVVWGIYGASPGQSGDQTIRPSNNALKVAMVQRNFPCVFKARAERPLEAYGRLLDNVAMLRPDLVVMSESALGEFGRIGSSNAAAFARWVSDRTGCAALLAGGSRRDGTREYNSAALYAFRPELATLTDAFRPQVYDKAHLVPFGEYIPGDKLVPALQRLAPVGSCTPGELKTLELTASDGARIPVGVAICYEDTDSAQVRELARQGARLLVFITNDSWFSQSVEAEQHAWQAVSRAIETGLPVVRVGNGGVTGTITPSGETTWLLGPDLRPLVDHEGTMLDRISVAGDDPGAGRGPEGGTPPYVVWGDAPLAVVFALLITAMVLVKYKANYEQRRTLSL